MDYFSDESDELEFGRSARTRRSNEAPRSRSNRYAESARSKRSSRGRAYYSSEEESQDENEIAFRPENVAGVEEDIEEVHLVKRVGGRGKSWSTSQPQQPIVQPNPLGRSVSIPIQGFKPKDASGSSRECSARSQNSISTASDVEAFLNRGQIKVKSRTSEERTAHIEPGIASRSNGTDRSSDWNKAQKKPPTSNFESAGQAPAPGSGWNAARPSPAMGENGQRKDIRQSGDEINCSESVTQRPSQLRRMENISDDEGDKAQDGSADFDHHDIYDDVDAVDMPQQRLRVSESPGRIGNRHSGALRDSTARNINVPEQQEREEEEDYENDGIEVIDGNAIQSNSKAKRKKKKNVKNAPPVQQPSFAKLEAYAALRQQRDLNMSPIRKSGRYSDDSGGDFDGEQRTRQQQEESKRSKRPRPPMPSGPPRNVRGNGWMEEEPQVNSSDNSPTNEPQRSADAVAIAAGSNAPLTSPTSRYSFVHIAHKRGQRTEHVQCTVLRERSSLSDKFAPTYKLILETTQKTLIIAKKMSMNRTSNYHLFDMTRGQLSKKLSKKSGNYIGKLRSKNMNRTDYVLLNQNSEREELAGVRFERMTMVDQLKEGNQPRKMQVIVPKLASPQAEEGYMVPVPNSTKDGTLGSFAEKLRKYDVSASRAARGNCDFFVYESKDPVYQNGNYRLNFNGRVSMPSVKNFQMVCKNDINNIVCQFGKVEEDVFHLDFKAPVNACQAFAFALCQFNL